MTSRKTLFIVGIVLLSACNLSGKIDAAIDKLDIFCTPGEEIECSCENGEHGSQTCSETGASFSDCTCGGSSNVQCTPGDVDVCVCADSEEFGTRECLGNREWDDCFCENETGSESETTEAFVCAENAVDTCACGPNRLGTKVCKNNAWEDCFCESSEDSEGNNNQWVLRDKNGEIVNAVFEPKCAGENKNDCINEPFEKNYPCILVHYLDSTPVWVLYNLSSGDPLSCYEDLDGFSGKIFGNESCEGEFYSTSRFGLTSLTSVEKIQNKLYWADYNTPGVLLQIAYLLYEGSCIQQDMGSQKIYEITEVSETIYNLLPESPYSIKLE